MADPIAEKSASAEPEPEPSKAGRNLPVAIAVGVFLGGIALASLIFVKWLFVVLAVVALWIGVSEVVAAMANRGIRVLAWPLYVGVPLVAGSAYLSSANQWGMEPFIGVFGGLVLVLLVGQLVHGTEHYVRDASASVLTAAYLPLMLGFAMLTLSNEDGAARVIVFIVLTVSSDIGGYIAGVLFGKHPMAPTISPKKSWEGFAGSLLFQSVLGVLLFVY